jgi:hypothetical protein
MAKRTLGSQKSTRAPRIMVPNQERALFTVDNQNFVGVIQRLSLTGGSAILSKGPIANGALGKMALNTVFGKVTAQIEFLRSGADGVPVAQAFRFFDMDDVSSRRFTQAVEQMEKAGFSDTEGGEDSFGSQTLGRLRGGIQRLSLALSPGRRIRAQR